MRVQGCVGSFEPLFYDICIISYFKFMRFPDIFNSITVYIPFRFNLIILNSCENLFISLSFYSPDSFKSITVYIPFGVNLILTL